MIDRDREREVLDRLLDGVRGERGGVSVVDGDAGVAKTALLEYAVGAAREFRIARTSGVEAEMELPSAAAQQLCSPFFDLLDRLPQPQHEALGVALGLSAGPAPGDLLAGLPELHVLSLGHRDARTLLESALPARLDEHVLDRIVVETTAAGRINARRGRRSGARAVRGTGAGAGRIGGRRCLPRARRRAHT